MSEKEEIMPLGRVWISREEAEKEFPISFTPPEPVIISIDWRWICEELLRKCKRNDDGFITDEYLIDACMKLSVKND